MYEIRSSLHKGLGVFAKSLIPKGTRIFSEPPLLAIRPDQGSSDIYSSALLLSATDREKLLELSGHATKELTVSRWGEAIWYSFKNLFGSTDSGVVKEKGAEIANLKRSFGEHVQILGIFRSNSFKLSTPTISQAVFAGISRINHSCIPNSQGNFHPGLGKFNVHAIRDISAGEEVSISYLPEHGAVREARQSKLEGYGFVCECQACDITQAQGKVGEDARVEMIGELAMFAEGEERNTEETLAMTTRFIDMLEGLDLKGRELSSLHFEAAKLYEKLGMPNKAFESAKRGVLLELDCLGKDHESYLEKLKMLGGMAVLPEHEEFMQRHKDITENFKLYGT